MGRDAANNSRKISTLRRRVRPSDSDNVKQEQQYLSNSYVEHHLTVAEVRDVYADSFIDADCPERSDGLTSDEARKRLRDGGRNIVPPPKEISNVRLFARQFLYKFWILLIVPVNAFQRMFESWNQKGSESRPPESTEPVKHSSTPMKR